MKESTYFNVKYFPEMTINKSLHYTQTRAPGTCLIVQSRVQKQTKSNFVVLIEVAGWSLENHDAF